MNINASLESVNNVSKFAKSALSGYAEINKELGKHLDKLEQKTKDE